MGAHSSAESLMAGVESDSIRVKATALAVQMTGWLAAPIGTPTPLDEYPASAAGDSGPYAGSDLIEWCRSARDVLEVVGRG